MKAIAGKKTGKDKKKGKATLNKFTRISEMLLYIANKIKSKDYERFKKIWF